MSNFFRKIISFVFLIVFFAISTLWVSARFKFNDIYALLWEEISYEEEIPGLNNVIFWPLVLWKEFWRFNVNVNYEDWKVKFTWTVNNSVDDKWRFKGALWVYTKRLVDTSSNWETTHFKFHVFNVNFDNSTIQKNYWETILESEVFDKIDFEVWKGTKKDVLERNITKKIVWFDREWWEKVEWSVLPTYWTWNIQLELKIKWYTRWKIYNVPYNFSKISDFLNPSSVKKDIFVGENYNYTDFLDKNFVSENSSVIDNYEYKNNSLSNDTVWEKTDILKINYKDGTYDEIDIRLWVFEKIFKDESWNLDITDEMKDNFFILTKKIIWLENEKIEKLYFKKWENIDILSEKNVKEIPGYVFKWWKKDSGEENFDFNQTINSSTSPDITIIWKYVKEYTVTFNSEENTVIKTLRIEDWETIPQNEIPQNPEKTGGYNFAHWENNWVKFELNSRITSNLNLTPKFSEIPKKSVKINEIDYSWNAISNWVELYNPTNSEIDISWWNISDDKRKFSIPQNSKIWPKWYFLIVNDSQNFKSLFNNLEPDFEIWRNGLSLAKGWDFVLLKDNFWREIQKIERDRKGILNWENFINKDKNLNICFYNQEVKTDCIKTPKSENKIYAQIKYEFSSNSSLELPDFIKNQKPTAKDSYIGENFVPENPTITWPINDNVNNWTWTFISYNQNPLIIDEKDEIIVWTWEFSANPLDWIITWNVSDWVRDDVTLTLETTENVNTPAWWTRIDDKNFSKTFWENISSSVTINSKVWNKSKEINFEISKIDKNVPAINNLQTENNVYLTKENQIKIVFSAQDNLSWLKSYECKKWNWNFESCQSWEFIFDNLVEWKNIFTLKVTDNAWNFIEKEIFITKDTTWPVISDIEDKIFDEWKPIENIVLSTNSQEDRIEISKDNIFPEGLNYDKNTKTISWTPSKPGRYIVKIKAFDSLNNESQKVFLITIRDVTASNVTISDLENISLKNFKNYKINWQCSFWDLKVEVKIWDKINEVSCDSSGKFELTLDTTNIVDAEKIKVIATQKDASWNIWKDEKTISKDTDIYKEMLKNSRSPVNISKIKPIDDKRVISWSEIIQSKNEIINENKIDTKKEEKTDILPKKWEKYVVVDWEKREYDLWKKYSCPIVSNIVSDYNSDYKLNFWDINFEHNLEELQKLAKVWVINWTKPGFFEPNRWITRAEFLAIILKTHCYDISQKPDFLPFYDVDLDSWQAKVVKIWSELWLVKGYMSDEKWIPFKPNQTISKMEAFAVMMKMADITISKDYKDSYIDKKADWQAKTLATWEYLWIINPKKTNFRFYPNASLSRNEMVKIIVDIIKLY